VRILFSIASLSLAAALLAQAGGGQRQRILRLENSLLAPCCYSEPVARHMSDVAIAMRAEIEQFVASGRSDQEILDLYTQRYGARILVEPQGARWWWMHVVPVAVLVLGLVAVALVLRKWLRPLPSS